MGLARGPLRLGVGEVLVGGHIHMVLACGHTVPPCLDEDGLWEQEAKCCKQCLQEFRNGRRKDFGLTDGQIRAAIERGDWLLTSAEIDDLVKDAHRAWYVVRYGRRKVDEQGAQGS